MAGALSADLGIQSIVPTSAAGFYIAKCGGFDVVQLRAYHVVPEVKGSLKILWWIDKRWMDQHNEQRFCPGSLKIMMHAYKQTKHT
jgi:hypothetical protein